MSKETLIQFCRNQKFHFNFDFKLLKDFTFYKNEDDKTFDIIIDEIKNELELYDSKLYCPYTYNVQQYIDYLISTKNKIELNDILKLCPPKIKYIFNKYIEQNNTNIVNISKPKKVIIKKIIKKIVKKKETN
jgi:hypothetical protein